ncbi:MAG: PAS domain-containing protein, partial [Casimicrobiaceae bacterium]
MALTRSLNRLELAPVPPTVGAELDRGALAALSQRKLNALATPLAYVDRTRRFRFANTVCLEWLGKRASDVIGCELAEVLGREHQQFFGAYIDAALAGEQTNYEWQFAAAGRPATWVRVDYFPDRNQQGHVRGFLATWSDVDALKNLEREAGQREHRLRLVTDSVGLPILHFDRQFRLRFVNRPFSEWIGIAPDDLLGHTLEEFLPSDALTEMKGYIERAFAGATVSCERRERRAAGDLRWVRITLFPDREMSGRVCGAFAVW